MIELFPEGSPLGRLQASFQWVLTHTSRFRGLMTVTVGEGEGFLLINRGNPVGCYFQLGKNILRGKAAYAYFKSLPVVDLSLRRYTGEEFAAAARVIESAGIQVSGPVQEDGTQEGTILARPDEEQIPAITGPDEGLGHYPEERLEVPADAFRVPSGLKMPESPEREAEKLPEQHEEGQKAPSGQSEPVGADSREPEKILDQEPGRPDKKMQELPEQMGPGWPHETTGGSSGEEGAEDQGGEMLHAREDEPGSGEEEVAEYPEGLDSDTLGHLLMGRILSLPGVQAVSIFGRGRSLLSVGDVGLDSLVVVADDVLEAAKRISMVIETGPFVHLTLQIPAGNVIIRPYFNEYLCIFTGPRVNLGHVRKILKEIPAHPEVRRAGP